MKTFLTIVFSLTFSLLVFAQEETLVGNDEVSHGGFGGPVVKFTQIKGEPGVLVGGRGGWIINHSFVIGGGGYGLVSDVDANNAFLGTKPFITFGYGGVDLEFIIQSDKVMHFSVDMLVGGGGITYRRSFMNWDWTEMNFGNDQFFVFEPAASIELNVVSFCRLDAGVSYRFISGLEFDDLTNKDLAGASAVLTLKFGKF